MFFGEFLDQKSTFLNFKNILHGMFREFFENVSLVGMSLFGQPLYSEPILIKISENSKILVTKSPKSKNHSFFTEIAQI